MLNTKYLFIYLALFSYTNASSQTWQKLQNLNQNIRSVHTSGNNVIAGLATGVTYTSNNGVTWNISSGISTVCNDFEGRADTLLAAGREKVFKSVDSGQSWIGLPTIFTNTDLGSVLISDHVYIAGLQGRGIYYSTDNGSSWTGGTSSWQGNNTDVIRMGDRIYASYRNSGYMQHSTNPEGTQWAGMSGVGIKNGSLWPNVYALGSYCENTLIAGVSSSSGSNGVYFSTDQGDNWSKKTMGLADSSITAITTSGEVIFVGTAGGGVFYSANEGDSWITFNNNLSELTINALYLDEATLYAATANGIFKIDICSILKNNVDIDTIGSTTFCLGDSVVLKASCGYNYLWLNNNNVISNASGNELVVKSAGSYQVISSISPTCQDTSSFVNVIVNTVDTSVLSTDSLLYSIAVNAVYQWLDCDNGFAPISGETNQYFTATVNGNYAVELTENGCVDTSSCVAITTVGIIENTFNEDFTLYPNPTDGMFSIEFNSSQEHITLSIMDASGKLIGTKNYNQVHLIEYELNQPKGIYLIEVSDGENQRSLIRIIKQ